MSDRESILRKIERLLAISQRATGPEADTALNHARRLMEQYQVTAADVGERNRFRERTVWTGSRRPVWSDFVLSLCYEFFFCHAIHSAHLSPERKLVRSLILFGEEANLAVGEYAYVALGRQFGEQLRLCKPRNQRGFCAGLVNGVREKLKADERGWAKRSIETCIILQSRKVELDEAYRAATAGCASKPFRKLDRDGLRDSVKRGMMASQDVEFNRPLAAQKAPFGGLIIHLGFNDGR